jgi:hypothetical protein
MTALALAMITTAVSSPSVYWPTVMPGSFVHFGVTHLGPFRRLAYLAHLSGAPRFGLPRAGFLHGVLSHGGFLHGVLSHGGFLHGVLLRSGFLHSGFLRSFR